MDAYLQIGTILGAHGIRGAVKVFPLTDDLTRFQMLETVVLCRPDERPGSEIRHVLDASVQKNLVLLRLSDVADRNAAEELRHHSLWISREEAAPLRENEYYMADLIGLQVFTEGEELGILQDVLQTGANDVYIVQTAQYGEVLIPAIRDCIQQVDLAAGRMDVRLLPGLLEL